MSEWTPFLNTRASESVRLVDGSAYGGFSNYVHSPVLNEEPQTLQTIKELLPKLHLLPERERSRIPRAIFMKNGHVHILEFGYLRTRLGEDFPYALNGTRSIPYTFGLSAPVGTPIPSLEELDNRNAEIKAEIGKLVTAVNERRDVQAEARSFTFEGSGYKTNLWDVTAKQIMDGDRSTKMVVTEMEHLKPGIGDLVPDAIFSGSKKNFATTNQRIKPGRFLATDIREAIRTGPSTPSKSSNTLIKAVVVCVAVFSGIWALTEAIRRLQSREESQRTKI
jgi:hypothetical protein